LLLPSICYPVHLVWAAVFIILLFDGLLYAWRKGAMQWW
jgi:NADH:ubiquinone oxidoreductase subunit 3 (subunit A)